MDADRSINFDVAIALAICALALLVLTNTFPLVTLQLNGFRQRATLWSAAVGLYQQGFSTMAALVLLTTVVIPWAQILLLFTVFVGIKMQKLRSAPLLCLQALTLMRPWGMVEVFMLATLVALVKLAALADIIPGIALYSCAALMFCMAGLSATAPSERLWSYVP